MQACLSPLVLKNRFGCLKRSSKFLSVLENVLEELEVQSIELAEEIKTMNPEILEKIKLLLPDTPISFIPHEEMKKS